jgi:hypothetical protein
MGALGEKMGLPSIKARLDFSGTPRPGSGVPGTVKVVRQFNCLRYVLYILPSFLFYKTFNQRSDQ